MIKSSLRAFVAIAVFVLPAVAVRAADSPDAGDWKPLFDGKTLTGWHHFGEGKWVVEDGAIVGRTDRAAKLYSLLISDGVYFDFDIRFKFKSIKGNSGFYIRTVTQDPDMAHGLQIEVDPRHNSGGIYESYRRQWVDKPTPEEQEKYFKKDEWNEVVISAHGGEVKVTTNGFTTADLHKDPSRPAGQLAMQMHAGNDMLVYFKDIEIKEVPRAKGEDKKGPTTPAKIEASKGGVIVLPAKHAKISGKSLAYMPEWDALGFWRATDTAEWEVEVPKAGTYDVTMEWSVDDKTAGHPFVIESGSHKLEAKVEGTKRWDTYRIKNVGKIELDVGTQTIAIKPGGKFDHALMDFRELRLTPGK
jgi:hypothetical protein